MGTALFCATHKLINSRVLEGHRLIKLMLYLQCTTALEIFAVFLKPERLEYLVIIKLLDFNLMSLKGDCVTFKDQRGAHVLDYISTVRKIKFMHEKNQLTVWNTPPSPRYLSYST